MASFLVQITHPTKNLQASVRVNQFTQTALDAAFQNVHTRSNGVKDRTKLLRDASSLQTQTVIWGGVRCNILSLASDPHLKTKRDALKKVLEALAGQTGMDISGNTMDVCMVSTRSTPQTSHSNMSVGYVYQDADSSPSTQRVCLILGDSICEKGSDTLVADSVHDYYKGTFTVSAKLWRAMAAVHHEFGHIFHQLHSPHHYWAIQDLHAAVVAKTNFATSSGYSTFVGSPSFQVLQDVDTAMLAYGRMLSGYATKHPLEVVAETYSSLMVGAPLSSEQTTAYTAMGGFLPTTGAVHKRTGKNWVKRNILYPVAEAIGFIGE